jgi:hypothetical protein
MTKAGNETGAKAVDEGVGAGGGEDGKGSGVVIRRQLRFLRLRVWLAAVGYYGVLGPSLLRAPVDCRSLGRFGHCRLRLEAVRRNGPARRCAPLDRWRDRELAFVRSEKHTEVQCWCRLIGDRRSFNAAKCSACDRPSRWACVRHLIRPQTACCVWSTRTARLSSGATTPAEDCGPAGALRSALR